MNNQGTFTISLDFELFWGMRDVQTLESYGENIRNVHNVIPKILQLFTTYEIHATWAIVGFLFFENKEQLLLNIPSKLPGYENKGLDPYCYINTDTLDPVYHFAPASVKLIQSTPNQEIGTHTFSHYYTLEKGQTLEEFKADIKTAIDMQAKMGNQCVSIVFPRNQYNEDHIRIIKELGIEYYRGNESFWVYKPRELKNESLWMRMVRLADAYINISGYNTFKHVAPTGGMPANIPASRFLRPYSSALKPCEGLKYRRIINSMTHAAKHNEGYHLWWHPHNFGKNSQVNLDFLEKILKHYKKLNNQYGFLSKSMKEY